MKAKRKPTFKSNAPGAHAHTPDLLTAALNEVQVARGRKAPVSKDSQKETTETGEVSPQKAKRMMKRGLEDYSDLVLDNWRDYESVETDSLWMINGRERQNGHQLDYHGNCVPQILTQLLTRFTKENDVILDLFCGSGTSAIEAANLNRRAIGVELKPEMVEWVRQKLKEQGKSESTQIIQGDSTDPVWTGKAIQRTLSQFKAPEDKSGQKLAQFLFLHPPYADIIQFSEHEKDLSNADSTEGFLQAFEAVCRLGYEQLAPGRFAAVVIGDKYADGELIPLGFLCMERMNRAGFKTKSIIVKNISGNEKAKGRTSNLWRYRALAGGFYVFKHEYVILFQKPKASKGRN